MTDIIFEEIKDKHLIEVLEIYNYYVINTTSTFHIHALTIEGFKELVYFNNIKYKTFVISSNNEIFGYVILTQYKKREAYDETAEVTVYLNPDYTGKGIGSLAIKYIEAFAKSNNIHVLIATICGKNSKSIGLFERNGYTKCAHYKEVGRKFGQFLDIVAYQKIIS